MPKIRRVDFSPDEWIGGTIALSNADRGLYITACAMIYSHGGPIKIDDLFAACTDHATALKNQLKRLVDAGKLVVKGSQITNKRAENELQKARKRSLNGRKNVDKRWENDRYSEAEPSKNNGVSGETVLQAGKPEPIPRRKANHQPSTTSYQKLASSLEAEQLPRGWIEEAAAERAAAGLPEVDLPAEWAKFRKVSGDNPTLSRWVKWALKADGRTPKRPRRADDELPETPWKQRLDGWVRKNFWLPVFGPKPNEPGCGAPPEMIRAAIEARRQNGAAHAAA